MVGFIVEDNDALLVTELSAHALHNLVRCLRESTGLVATEQFLRKPSGVPTLLWKEGMVVLDDDLRSLQSFEQVRRQNVTLAVVVVGIVRQKNAQAIADRDSRANDEKGIGESGVLRIRELVERLPGDQHPHNDG